ncbi:threonine/serine dehydratase [uncultured Albimonas sp.]|uniref:threonine/serine dehydratase n=1 Tax=uncultured Albimonas sp. TaxID=1331701 RepID=UPI0030EB86C4|tara:strand:+ start:1208 stop:2155 length:948 start_codon:yes stop_codon:yes gene_type:complete
MPVAALKLTCRKDVEDAYRQIVPHVRRTPVIEVDPQDFGLNGFRLFLKLELMQHGGSFKTRGAFANLVGRRVPAAGVVAASGGNHGVAVAFAAARTGVRATIFVPSVANPSKIAAIRALGAEARVTGDRYDEARAAAEAHAEATGALSVHAYDSHETLCGQGTVALEFEAQAAPDTVLVATGGGGLISGMAAYLCGLRRLVAVEPEAAPTLHMALAAGRPVDAPGGGVAADSLAPLRVGEIGFPLAQRYVARSALVADAAIVAAQKRLWSVCRVAAEPAGAAALAALLSGAYRPDRGEAVGVLVCGGNTDAVAFD